MSWCSFNLSLIAAHSYPLHGAAVQGTLLCSNMILCPFSVWVWLAWMKEDDRSWCSVFKLQMALVDSSALSITNTQNFYNGTMNSQPNSQLVHSSNCWVLFWPIPGSWYPGRHWGWAGDTPRVISGWLWACGSSGQCHRIHSNRCMDKTVAGASKGVLDKTDGDYRR